MRIDVGGRVQHLHLHVAGNYNLEYRDDAYRANYDYLAPLLAMSVASQRMSRVNAVGGFGVGTAALFSDRQGKPLRVRHLPVYGSFEAGLLIRITEDIDLRAGVSWVPPVDNLNVLTAQLGGRVRL